MFIPQENANQRNVDILVLEDHGDTIEEDIENEENEKRSPDSKHTDSLPKKGHDSTTTNSNKQKEKEATFGEN